jgi:hypothetical protein
MSGRKRMCEIGWRGDVEGLSRLLDEGVDPADRKERNSVSRVVCASVSHV